MFSKLEGLAWWEAALAVLVAAVLLLGLFVGVSWVVMALVNYLFAVHITIYQASGALILAEIAGHVLFKKRIIIDADE